MLLIGSVTPITEKKNIILRCIYDQEILKSSYMLLDTQIDFPLFDQIQNVCAWWISPLSQHGPYFVIHEVECSTLPFAAWHLMRGRAVNALFSLTFSFGAVPGTQKIFDNLN